MAQKGGFISVAIVAEDASSGQLLYCAGNSYMHEMRTFRCMGFDKVNPKRKVQCERKGSR